MEQIDRNRFLDDSYNRQEESIILAIKRLIKFNDENLKQYRFDDNGKRIFEHYERNLIQIEHFLQARLKNRFKDLMMEVQSTYKRDQSIDKINIQMDISDSEPAGPTRKISNIPFSISSKELTDDKE